MTTAYVQRQVTRINRNLLLVNGIVLGLTLAFIVFTMLGGLMVARMHERGMANAAAQANRAFQDANAIYHQPAAQDVAHPAQISVSDVASPERLQQLDGHAVTLADPQAQNLHFPVWEWMTRATGKNKPHSPPMYYVSQAQGHPFLILPGSTNRGTAFTGVIRPLAKADEDAVRPVLMGHGFVQEPMPFLLDGLNMQGSVNNSAAAEASIHQAQAQALSMQPGLNLSPTALVVFGLVIGLTGWNVFKAIQRGKNPLTHPIYAKLGRYGSPLDISRAIDAEASAGMTIVSPVEFTHSWLLFPSLFTLDAVPLDQIAWVYKMVTLYNLIPMSFRLVLLDRDGKNHPISAGSGQVNDLLEYIGQVRPGVIMGYSRQMRYRFFSDRASVLAEIDARRPKNTL